MASLLIPTIERRFLITIAKFASKEINNTKISFMFGFLFCPVLLLEVNMPPQYLGNLCLCLFAHGHFDEFLVFVPG